jgi:hypothetical protein
MAIAVCFKKKQDHFEKGKIAKDANPKAPSSSAGGSSVASPEKERLQTQERRLRFKAAPRPVFGAVRVSTLNLVDLAGSESVRHTGATGDRQKEGGMINARFVPYMFSERNVVGLIYACLTLSFIFFQFTDSFTSDCGPDDVGRNGRRLLVSSI